MGYVVRRVSPSDRLGRYLSERNHTLFLRPDYEDRPNSITEVWDPKDDQYPHTYAFSVAGTKEQREIQARNRAAQFQDLRIRQIERWSLGSCSEWNAWTIALQASQSGRGRELHSKTALVKGGLGKPRCANCAALAGAMHHVYECQLTEVVA